MGKRIICKQCGAVNALGQMSESEEIVPCEISKDLDWFLPMKRITSEKGEMTYMDQQGKLMTREQYIQTHNLDPEIAQKMMKRHIGEYVGD